MYAVCELDGSDNLKASYIYANGLLLGRIDADNTKYYYHHDGLGSTMLLTDQVGNVVQSYLYDEFGDLLLAEGTIQDNSYLYTGK